MSYQSIKKTENPFTQENQHQQQSPEINYDLEFEEEDTNIKFTIPQNNNEKGNKIFEHFEGRKPIFSLIIIANISFL
jgi:hypothetical protein